MGEKKKLKFLKKNRLNNKIKLNLKHGQIWCRYK